MTSAYGCRKLWPFFPRFLEIVTATAKTANPSRRQNEVNPIMASLASVRRRYVKQREEESAPSSSRRRYLERSLDNPEPIKPSDSRSVTSVRRRYSHIPSSYELGDSQSIRKRSSPDDLPKLDTIKTAEEVSKTDMLRKLKEDGTKSEDAFVSPDHKSAVVTLTKSSSLRRRRHSNGNSEDDGSNVAAKKGNFSVAFKDEAKDLSQPSHLPALAVTDEDEVKFLDSIEIKSAAQWKAMSQTVSWKEEESDQPSFNFRQD